MSEQMVVGAVVSVLGIVMVIGVAFAKGEPFAYLTGLLVGELGTMLLVMGMTPAGIPSIGVALFFAVSIGWTNVQLWKLRPRPPSVSG